MSTSYSQKNPFDFYIIRRRRRNSIALLLLLPLWLCQFGVLRHHARMRRLFKSAVAGPKTAAPQPVVMAAKEKVGRTRSREDFWTRGLEQKKKK